MKPRVLFVGRTRYRFPLNRSLARKFDALGAQLDYLVLAAAAEDGARAPRFALVPPQRPRVLDGALWHVLLPLRVARALRRFGPEAVLVESPFEGAAVVLAAALARRRTRLVLDVHGDWRTATRLYGSPLRRLVSPLADRVATWAVRRADAVRPVGEFTASLVRRAGVEPAGVFPAFIDVDAFTREPPAPLPERPVALFVGVLELYKNVDGIAEAWRLAAPRVPDARLRLVGIGSRADVVERLVRDLPEQTSWTPVLAPDEVARALDDSWFLLLASRSEGLPRIVVEALARGRPVLGARSGGIPDVVHDGVNGLLVAPDDPRALADAVVRLLSDRALVERLAARARASVEPFVASPEEYARRIRALVEATPERAA